MTKPVTATAVMQLVETGLVDVDEPISTYVPEFDPLPPGGQAHAGPVTVRHVLSHTSGLSDLPDLELRRLHATQKAMLDAVSRQRLRFEPGTAYAYASDPWNLLSAIIERVSGTPFPAYLRNRVLGPLRMNATSFDSRDPGPEPLPPQGSFVLDDLAPDQLVTMMAGLAMPGGGLWSTPEDVANFGRAMLLGGEIGGAQVLTPLSLERMIRLETGGLREFGTGEPVHYGLGWSLPGLAGGSPASQSAFGHGGATGSALLVDPAHDLVIVYLRNWWGVSSDATDEAVAAVYAAFIQGDLT
ncbi:MAG TPA: serine hydrolase domain-containing protein [Candidatus Limnocylindria bacterium]|nr:serine hydrolase domain-containing protein [Candidatus Limnocylindria bacterium]